MLYAFKVSLFFINLKVSIFILIVHWLFTSNQLQGSECNYLIKSRPWLHSMFNFNVRSMSSQQLITLPWFNKLTNLQALFFVAQIIKMTSIRVQVDFNRIQEHIETLCKLQADFMRPSSLLGVDLKLTFRRRLWCPRRPYSQLLAQSKSLTL